MHGLDCVAAACVYRVDATASRCLKKESPVYCKFVRVSRQRLRHNLDHSCSVIDMSGVENNTHTHSHVGSLRNKARVWSRQHHAIPNCKAGNV